MANASPRLVIADFGLGNLYSIGHACRHVGLAVGISADWREVERADGVILPGVGAFGDAMAALKRLELDRAIHAAAAAGKPLLGICLGMQLLLERSEEFGSHAGLGLVAGEVVRLVDPVEDGRALKVPQVGWNAIRPAGGGCPDGQSPAAWAGTPLAGVKAGENMYFVHSYYARPADPAVALAVTTYGHVTYCSSLRQGNVFATQFHPERSAGAGLQIYANLRSWLQGEL